MHITASHARATSTGPTLNADAILQNFKLAPLNLKEDKYTEWKNVLLDSFITEYDARRLYRHLADDHHAIFIELKSVLGPWLLDELDHAHGFSIIYSAFTATPMAKVLFEAEARKSDFTAIQTFVDDPLKLLVMLAYDEIITTHVYQRSIANYDRFGNQQLSNWIRKIKKDETAHFFFIH